MRLSFFATPVLLLAASLVAHASTVIDFNTLPGTNGDLFTIYSENGFTVANSLGQYFVGTAHGNPVPDIFGDISVQTPTTSIVDSVTITATNGSAFRFDQVDLAVSDGNNVDTYSFTGLFNGSQVYMQSGTMTDSFSFFTYDSNDPGVELTSLTITQTGEDFNIDNIVLTQPSVSATPEPSSLILLGTGVLGVAGAARRRLRRA